MLNLQHALCTLNNVWHRLLVRKTKRGGARNRLICVAELGKTIFFNSFTQASVTKGKSHMPADLES